MADTNIREQVRKLVELQKVDIEIYDYKRKLKEKPVYLEELKSQFDRKKIKLNGLEERYKKLQLDRRDKEGQLQDKDNAIAKANTHLSQIKTNKEYTAKITEIENIKADKSIIEEHILMSYDEADAVKIEVETEKKALAEEEKKYLAAKKEIEDAIKEIGDRIKVLTSQRQQIIPEINKSYLSLYERILMNKDGLAIVPVQGHSCGGCFMNVPDQVVNEMKAHDKIIICEMCARILYLEEDL